MWTWTQAFDWEVWLALAVCCLLAAVAMWAIERLSSRQGHRKLQRGACTACVLRRPGSTLAVALGVLLRGPGMDNPCPTRLTCTAAAPPCRLLAATRV